MVYGRLEGVDPSLLTGMTGTARLLRASVPGFLTKAYPDEGDRVYQSLPLGTLEVLDLESRVVQKRAEVRAMKAKRTAANRLGRRCACPIKE